PCLLVFFSPCLLFSLSPCLLVSLSPCLLVSLSPCLLVSLSPCLLVSLSPCLLVSLSPCLLVSLSPCLLVSLSPCLLVSLTPCLVGKRHLARPRANKHDAVMPCPGHLHGTQQVVQFGPHLEHVHQQYEQLIVPATHYAGQQGAHQHVDLARRGQQVA